MSASTSQSGFSFLVNNSAAQERQFRAVFALLQEAIAARSFPACSLAVTHRGELVAHKAFGRFTYDSSSSEVTPATIFDLASVTKVVATTSMAMILYERGILDLETPVIAIVPELVPEFAGADARRSAVTLRMLLAHSSGLPAYEKLFLRATNREALQQAAFTTELAAAPATRAEYSDIGFIILGIALERLADESLDTFCQREVFGPLAMSHTTFNPAKTLRDSIPPTADDHTIRHRIIQGEVQDENASILGGVAGHAGLFSTAGDLALFAHAMLNGGYPILRPETVNLFTRREPAPEGTSRALGWDTPSHPSQSGKHFGPQSFGHLGYTGTSLWIDPERQLSITLLTNRTWPDSQNQAIKQVRPALHDAVMQALEIKFRAFRWRARKMKARFTKRGKEERTGIGRLATEKSNSASTGLDSNSSIEIARIINREDAKVAGAVARSLPQIAQAIDWIADALSQGGRLIYVGTGTSGRVAALDAAECPPTFNTSRRMVQFIMAGGTKALAEATEASEDSRTLGRREMAKKKPSGKDVVVGVAASGRTPFTIAAVEEARAHGAKTVAVTCNRNSPLEKAAHFAIVAEVGPEVVAGSTRMKAGTAQKMILNMLTTGAMTRLGYVYGNLMVNLHLKNEKLMERGIGILEKAAGLKRDKARRLLKAANRSVPVALVMAKAQVSRAQAVSALKESLGHVRKAIAKAKLS